MESYHHNEFPTFSELISLPRFDILASHTLSLSPSTLVHIVLQRRDFREVWLLTHYDPENDCAYGWTKEDGQEKGWKIIPLEIDRLFGQKNTCACFHGKEPISNVFCFLHCVVRTRWEGKPLRFWLKLLSIREKTVIN